MKPKEKLVILKLSIKFFDIGSSAFEGRVAHLGNKCSFLD